MKHVELFEGWLDSLTSGFSGKSKPAPEDYSYQGSKFRYAKDMWDHPERYNKEMYRDHDAALQELEDDMGTREILMLSPYSECKELSAIHQILRLVALNSSTSMGTASFADSEREKDPCDNEGHLLKIDPDRGRFSKENWFMYHRFKSYYFMNERFGFLNKGGLYTDFEHTYITKDCYHRWFETQEKLDSLLAETREAHEYRFWKTDPKIIAGRYTECGIDTLFKVAYQMEKSQGEDFLIACDLDQRIKKDPNISFSLFGKIRKSQYDKLLKSLQGEASDDAMNTAIDLGELGF